MRTKTTVFAAMTLAFLIAFMEAMSAWFSSHYRQQLFSYQSEYMEAVTADQFEHFVASPYFDAHLGWDNPKELRRATGPNCIGKPIDYVYENGARVTPGVSADQAQVALFGESFTQGEEVNNQSTIAAVLMARHGLPTMNYGVNAYDPL